MHSYVIYVLYVVQKNFILSLAAFLCLYVSMWQKCILY